MAKNSKGELIDLEQRPGPPRRQQVMVPVPTANPAPAVRTSAPTSSTKRMPSRSLSPAPAPKKGVKAPKSLSDASVQEIQEVQPRTHTQKPRTRTHVQKPQTRTHVEDVQPRVRPAQKIYGRSPELIMAEPEGKDIRRQFARVAERTSELSTELKNLGVMMGNSVKNVQKQLNKLNDKVLEDDSASSSESETDSQASYHQNEWFWTRSSGNERSRPNWPELEFFFRTAVEHLYVALIQEHATIYSELRWSYTNFRI